ncbi:MAG: CDP-diacylglycerol--glycerol-3-phosphate 3-phosphatidyltransferase [Desulfomicrobium escambiense]|nr:CDP-diacylglycerol--glycerol-3-phosphate 3-phosphatidyltransferase [Desulfomicrobium escambiense]
MVEWGDLIAGAVFILAALTDTAFDGYIARKRGIVTNLGKFIDPLADKILITAALVGLVELQRISAWIVVVILAREFIVTGSSDDRRRRRSRGLRLPGRENKTVAQIIAIVMMIFNLPLALTAMWIALLLTVWSGMDYLVKGWSS